jgi:histidine triad (HIT) family protein
MEECIFCKIIKGEIPSFKIYEDDMVYAFEDINPVAEGHTLVIPKEHAKDLSEISNESISAVHKASKKIMDAIKRALKPTGVAVVQLNGESVGQSIFHYHIHLIPRLEGNPPLPVAQMEMIPGDMEQIEKTAEKIKLAFG